MSSQSQDSKRRRTMMEVDSIPISSSSTTTASSSTNENLVPVKQEIIVVDLSSEEEEETKEKVTNKHVKQEEKEEENNEETSASSTPDPVPTFPPVDAKKSISLIFQDTIMSANRDTVEQAIVELCEDCDTNVEILHLIRKLCVEGIILMTMRKYSRTEIIVRHCCMLLSKLASDNTDAVERLILVDCMETILDILKRFQYSEATVEKTMELLEVLFITNTKATKQIVKKFVLDPHNGVQLLVSIMERHLKNFYLQMYSIGILKKLIDSDDGVKEVLLKAGALSVLQGAIKEHYPSIPDDILIALA